MYYNPLSHVILDKSNLEKYDNLKDRRSKRYQLRFNLEADQRLRDVIKNDIKDYKKSIPANISYERYKEEDTRGFNILSNNDMNNKYKNINFHSIRSSWQTLMDNTNKK